MWASSFISPMILVIKQVGETGLSDTSIFKITWVKGLSFPENFMMFLAMTADPTVLYELAEAPLTNLQWHH